MAYTAGLMLLLSCMFLLVLTSLATEPMGFNCAGPSGIEYTKNSSKYLANLDLLLSSLSAKAAADTGFDNATFGNGSDKVYGLFLCRGDITPRSCQNCTQYAGNEFKVYCANKASAIVWYDNCMIRYSDQNIFSNLQQQPAFYPVGPISITLDQYNQTVVGLMSQLVKQAVSGSSTPKYYATGEQNYHTGSDKVYGLVQCTPDITKDECYGCLNLSVSDISNKLYPKQGGRVLKPSCNLRYELNSYFYQQQASSSPATPLPTNPSSSATPPSTNSSVTDGKGSNSTLIVIAVIVIVVIIITIIIISILYLRFQKRKQKVKVEDDENEITVAESLQFNFDGIRAATDNFSDANKLGQGGFGAVYKGELLDGQIVAVKRLSRNSVQGDIEFKNEVILVTKLQHRNLVRLLGFCLKGEEKLLIYEFVSNASLDHFIFDPNNHSQLNWEVRYKIIEGIARGLLYLHEDSRLKIIHRDLKASNILLDEEMNPKIVDFGMARLFGMNQTQANTSRIVGTFGYMAPEYIMEGTFSVKTDVFSFGVLLLEIVSGQRNKNLSLSGRSEDLLSYAWRKWKDGSALELMYPTLRENYPRSEVIKCIHIGLLCVQENMSDRPTMASVVLMLSSYSTTTLPLPTSPAFFMHSEIDFGEPSTDNNSRVTTTSGQSTSNSTTKSANEMSITELSAR